jgi:hypothetical protein
MKKFVFTKLVNALLEFTESDLRKLRLLLEDPRYGRSLIQQIDSIMELRYLERQRLKSGDSRSRHLPRDQEMQVGSDRARLGWDDSKRPSESLENSFVAILEDRVLFPGTKDVIHALNAAFRLPFDYAKYRRGGRRDLIRKGWSHLASMPQQRREQMMRNFLDRYLREFADSDAYRDLFKILTGND